MSRFRAVLFVFLLIALVLSGCGQVSNEMPNLTPSVETASIGSYEHLAAWGSLGSGDGQFATSSGVAVDSFGNVYVADYFNARIQKFDSNGNFITKWGSYGEVCYPDGYYYCIGYAPDDPAGNGKFAANQAVAVDSAGYVYVAEKGNHRIQKFDSNGNFITKWGSLGSGDGQFNGPYAIAFDSDGHVYVADYSNNRIQKFDSNGNFITKWGSRGSGNGQFFWPTGVAVDSLGNVYVAEQSNHRIQKFDSNGNFITKWGSQGSGDGQFSNPLGITADINGNVYVAEQSNHRIQKFDSNGNFITKWGSQGSGDGQLRNPSDVAVDNDGNVYVADSGNHRVQKFGLVLVSADTTPPVITPNVAGTPGSNGWYTSNITVSWSVVDDESAISSQTGCDPATISADTTSITLTCEATSTGGAASESVTLKRDATAPTLAPTVSPNPVLLNNSATAIANATDALAGVASQSCDPVVTSNVGSKSVNCIATDQAGNTTSASASYTVTYTFQGFSQPVDNLPTLNSAKAGQAIPLKWRITDANGVPVTNLTGVQVSILGLSCSTGTGSDVIEEYATSTSGLQNLGNGYYQYNWKTPKSYAGSCKTMRLDLGEGAPRTAAFQFR